MDRDKLNQIMAALEPLLCQIRHATGCNAVIERASYGSTACTVTIEVADVAADGTVLSREAEAFKQYAPSYGLDKALLGTTFGFLKEVYKIVGWRHTSPTYPVLAEKVGTGKVYKFKVDTVKQSMSGSDD